MPLYEYQCSKCGEKFEVLQKFSDEPLKRHKGCRGSVHRLLSSPALHFKGSGWYVNDYASSSSRAEASAESKKESKAAESSSESKASDSKGSESKTSESKSSESKSGSSESKPAAKETKAAAKPAKNS
jgi:putative FmdB family regulatory protein